MTTVRVIVEYTDGTREMVSIMGSLDITDDESLSMVENQLKAAGRFEKVIAMKVKQ